MRLSIQRSLITAASKLKKANINSPELEARILLQHATSKPLEYLLTHGEEILTVATSITFEDFINKRLKFEPIAYITGIKEFYDHEFIINNSVLIPREDTELLVDSVLRNLDSRFHGNGTKEKSNDENNITILELGVGSGCISISLLLAIPNSMVIATDVSKEAIEVAESNAAKHTVEDRIKIIHSDWFENIQKEKFDFIVSNPPYVSQAETADMAFETVNYEPFIALFAAQDGLQAYYIIAQNAKKFLKPHGKLILEIGYTQITKVSKIFNDHGYNINHIYKDLQGHPRTLVMSYSNLNRSYARRIGKSLSALQQNLLETELPNYLFSPEKIKFEERQIFLEIGFGMGEHFIHQAKNNPEVLLIGVEVYLNGVANALKLALEQNVTNFLLWPNNLDLILDKLPNNSLDRIYILFPDPWTKNKQKKKRILNAERLNTLQNKIKNNGSLIFASDIDDYVNEALKLIQQNSNFKIENGDNYHHPHDNYIITKYHRKAINEGRTAQFIIAKLFA